MAVDVSRDIFSHNQFEELEIIPLDRSPSPYFAPPFPAWQREPGTDLGTIWTASGDSAKAAIAQAY